MNTNIVRCFQIGSFISQDIRPWKCDMCNHAAKEKGNLKKHLKSKHKMSVSFYLST